MQSNKKPYRYRYALPLAFGIVTIGLFLQFAVAAFLRLLELVIPEQWKGKYHGLIVRLYSNFPSSLVWELPLRIFGINLRRAKLSGANLDRVMLRKLDLREADFTKADLEYANLMGANLSHADLSEANLSGANLMGTNLSHANLSGAKLIGANLSNANLREAQLTGSFVYAISAWNINLEKTIQSNLIITRPDEPLITVDNLEVAQFIYLLLNNQKIRDVIDTVAKKVVLILGRFTPPQKVILDALRDELRKHDYLPILFDFEKPVNRDITETVSTLAHLARFVIADITEPKSIPQELSHIVPFLSSVPIVPLLQISEREYGMYEHFLNYPWVQPIYHYHDLDELLHSIQERIIDPAERKIRELALDKVKRLERP